MDLIGKTTINPIVFYTGKTAGYITWIILVSALFGHNIVETKEFYYNSYFSMVLFFIGLVFITISLINLGKSTRLGLPSNNTTIKTKGIYTLSRNPMYVGFNLITIASVIYTAHVIVLLLGIYSLITYHFIILGEERFLLSRFGDEYKSYQSKVRRYF